MTPKEFKEVFGYHPSQSKTPTESRLGVKKRRKRNPNPIVPYEEDEQKTFVIYLEGLKLDFFSVPNENSMSSLNKKTAMIQGAKSRAMGMRAGVQDLIVFLPTEILFIEMKRAKKSLTDVSTHQIEWHNKVKKYPYAKSFICYGAGEAMQVVIDHLR